MRLFHSPTSPYVRKVVVLLHETGQLAEVEIVPAAGNAVAAGTMPVGHNPLGKVPTVLLSDGTALYDSRVICRYLNDRASGGFYPEGAPLWDCLVREATGDGIIDAGILMVYESRLRPPEMQFAPWVEGQWAKIVRALDKLEAQWATSAALAVDIGHVAVACALGHLDFRHGSRDWRTGRPALADWYADFVLRTSMAATMPVG